VPTNAIFTVVYAAYGESSKRCKGARSDLLMVNTVTHHKFKIGQSVTYTSRPLGAGGASNVYKITQLLPPEGDEFQYRIKSSTEPHERVAKESQLDRAA